METLYLPVLGEKDKEPEVTGFYVLRNGKAKERVSSELAMESMLLQEKLKGFSCRDTTEAVSGGSQRSIRLMSLKKI